MPQLLALEWNESEARLVVASSRGNRAVIEQAFSVALDSSDAGEGEGSSTSVGEQIAAALAARRIGKIDTLVAIGRSSIELRLLSLPPAPDSELANMVRFQAMREFNEFNEDWLLDFLPIGGSEEGPRNVLAAAIGPELVGQIQETCDVIGLKPRRMVLRPCAAASLLSRSRTGESSSQVRLLIDLLADETDLTVMDGNQVVFLRTARLGSDPLQDPSQAHALLAEVRRTIAAAQNQLGGRRLESIVLCGLGEQHATIAGLIQEKLDVAVELFDPFADLETSRELQGTPPEHAGRFTPLLGMVLAELEGSGHAIDFLHPRRPAQAQRNNTKVLLAGAVAVMLIALYFVGSQWRKHSLEKEVGRLKNQVAKLDTRINKAKKAQKAMKEIDKWTASDVVWIEQLHHLSVDFPSAWDAMVTKITCSSLSSTGGTITLGGLARDSEAVTTVDQDLRAGEQRRKEKLKIKDEARFRHGTVTGSGQDAMTRHYGWKFDSILYVPPKEL